MAKTEKEYRRLPGRGLRQAGLVSVTTTRSTLWLGKDHLLSLDHSGFAEEYRRFYFRDIQAFIIRKTNSWMITNIVLGVLVLLGGLGIMSITYKDEPLAAITVVLSWILFVPCLLFLLINLPRGTTCKCYLRTAVQTEELPSLNRLRRARKVLNRLRPIIMEVQGSFPTTESQTEPGAMGETVVG